MKLIIEGAPRTKKNSLQIRRTRTGRPFIAQGEAAIGWEQTAVLQIRQQLRHIPGALVPCFIGPVNLCALIYRDRAGRADLLNYLAAISDALETAGVVANDELVAGLDGSRLFVDRRAPRVELEITILLAGQPVREGTERPGAK